MLFRKKNLILSLVLSFLIGAAFIIVSQLPFALSGEVIAKIELMPLIFLTLSVALLIYTLSLYAYKPGEPYLAAFLFLQLLVLLRILLMDFLHPALSDEATSVIGSAITWAIILMTLKISQTLADLALPSRMETLLHWPFLIGAGVLLFLAGLLLPWFATLRNLLVVLLAICILSDGCSLGRKGLFFALAGSSLVLGLYLSIIVNRYLPAKNDLFTLVRRTSYIDIPFLFGTMVSVNARFATAFHEKEWLSAHLERLVEERTHEIENLQEERHSMITNIFHDLRTPLFVIGNALDVLGLNPDALPDMLPLMKERSTFARNLTEDLFLLIKLRDGKVILGQQRVDLSGILSSLIRSLPEGSARPDLTVKAQIAPDLFVWGDPLRLQQIFQNLLVNAVHYTPEGGEIEVTAVTVPVREPDVLPLSDLSSATSLCQVRIKDSGPGIRESDRAHLFERYFHSDEQHKHDSSGLGLSIAHELVLLHQGRISFESEEGHGTTFLVELGAVE